MKKNEGFSLVELIVVVLIMGILAVALAPQVISYVEKSREAMCAQDRDGIKEAYYIHWAETGSSDYGQVFMEAFKEVSSRIFDEETGLSDPGKFSIEGLSYGDPTYRLTCSNICKSGGIHTYSINKATGMLRTECSVHEKAELVASSTVPDVSLVSLLTDSEVIGEFKKRIDSTGFESGTGTTFAKSIKSLEAYGDFLESNNIKTWAICKINSNNVMFWSDEDISKLKLGDTIKVICYHDVDKKYWAGEAVVKKGAGDYNVIDETIYNTLKASEGKDNYADILDTYNGMK